MTPFADLLLGATQEEFFFNKELICKNSDFFKAACNEYWESGQSNTVRLEEEDHRIFSIFLSK
jgi:hypothetical protein